ncbi:polysaccharide pyruvyl transferase family protein [Calidifontibacter sp. DB0510]|uniref:Polysaccharide pyruvyl transferase family protein n=1 Tax=Metallococcus carri TaxID=1656884 RepID=A0A967B217_9MICO|nr:polysaccharide pyruvyl transferase family protein [Metallococcus carri]NHN56557.1 polysaccharide pyruvyl transferase family protein [Metallococcus carri]NOP38856.1 polysaccharide pyruvyl transferase family protein [Calidifontibacter sp. DB2511S]
MSLKSQVRRWGPPTGVWRTGAVRLGSAAVPAARGNFGDQLAPIVVSTIFGVQVKAASLANCDLMAQGSLLEWLQEERNPLRPHVWGTGFIEDGGAWSGAPLRVHAVRGQLSRERLAAGRAAKVALGDPGILLDLVYPDLLSIPKRYDVSVVPHFVDFDDADLRAALRRHPQVHVVDVMAPARQVAAEIAASRLVLSSSLHGLIAAEAFGVPGHWMPISGRVTGGGYKYADYYSAFGVEVAPLALDEGLARACAGRLRSEPLPRWQERRRELLAAVPLRPTQATRRRWAGVTTSA